MKCRNLVGALWLVLALHTSWCRERKGYYTNRFAVQVDEREMASSIAESHGMKNRGPLANLGDFYIFQVDNGGKTFGEESSKRSAMNEALKMDSHVVYFEAEFKKPVENRFYTQPTDPLWNDQWFILNTGQLGPQFIRNDVNAERAWIQGITGCNVTVAVVDSGVEYTHPDLLLNYDPDVSRDICDDDLDPLPEYVFETHGTEVAAQIISGKSNMQCGTGVAYNAIFGSIRLTSCFVSSIDTANALTYRNDIVHIYSNSWGPRDDGSFVDGPSPMLQMVIQNAVEQGRDGKGSVIVFASGNGGEMDDDCSADGYCTNINTVAIGSASVDGTQAFYDESCSCKMAVNFISGNSSLSVATTTVGGCTLTSDGTSVSCPVASAVIALALEVTPNLTWRDVQYLIAYTSSHKRLIGGTCTTNGGGLAVSHEFGFGAMDAEAMVSRARHWITVPPQQSSNIIPVPSSGTALVSNPLMVSFTYDGSIVFLEHVEATMTVGVSTGMRGDLRIELTSPFGTTSTLIDYRDNDSEPGSYAGWPFMSVHFWGENPSGQWTLVIKSRSASSPVDMSGLVVTLYGTDEIPEAISNIPEQCDSACAGGCAGAGPEFCDACADLRDAHTRECITECPEGYEQRNKYCYDPTVPEPVCRSVTPGSCVAAGFTSCCENGDCHGSPQTCFCDELCYSVGDCCEDIDDICSTPDINYIPFIALDTTPGVDTQTIPIIDDGTSDPITVPGGFPMGLQNLSTVYVITNGYFSLESLFIEFRPQLFPVFGRYLVAPFWSDVNLENGVGRIRYEIHSSTTGGTVLQDISAYISSEEDVVFEAKWMLVAEWEGVSMSGGRSSITNSYQGVLVTDGVQSYALYTYRCGEMEWSGGATIGFGASDELYDNLRLSGSFKAATVACLNSPTTEWSNLLYKLTQDPVTVRFAQEMYTVSEGVGSQNLALYVCVYASTAERTFSVYLYPVSGTAVANVDWMDRTVQIEFQAGRSARECGCIEILDDTIPEDRERFVIELKSSAPGVVIAEPAHVVVEIEDDDGGEDISIMFINNSPRVIANSVTANFIVGKSFVSVSCSCTTLNPKDCSTGGVTFHGLNPDRGRAYTLTITGTLPNGAVVTLSRQFHVGTLVSCWAHLINTGITVNEDSVTIEWQGTGPGANASPSLPFQCRLDSVTTFHQCDSPHTMPISGLSNGEYVISIRYFDPNRLVCTNRNLARFDFQIAN